MITKVELQGDLVGALKDLVEIDFDAVAAYDLAISRLENEEIKSSLESFKEDHQRHIEEISRFIISQNETPPTGPSAKSFLTPDKVMLEKLIGDNVILRAMRSNEIDTNTVYGRINNYDDIPEEIALVLKKGLQDEKKHLAWIEERLG